MPRAAVVLLGGLLSAAAAVPVHRAHGDDLIDIRLYPAPEYTRLVIESKEELDYRLGLALDPPRLYLHFRTDDSDALLKRLDAVELAHAPYIETVRAARNDDEHLRIVFELSEQFEKSLFNLAPYDIYEHRTVLDITPAKDVASNLEILGDVGFDQQVINRYEPAARSAPALPAADFVVVLDPGHGGEDPGAVAADGTYESVIVLDIARRVQAHLADVLGIKVRLTRESNYFVPLRARQAKATEFNADLFVSIHADAHPESRHRGSSVFKISSDPKSESRLARELLHANEDRGVARNVGEARVERFMAENSKEAPSLCLDLSADVSDKVGRSIKTKLGKLRGHALHNRADYVHEARFAVLYPRPERGCGPAVLVEVGFMSNPTDLANLRRPAFRDEAAHAIARGIVEYAATQSDQGVRE